MTHPPGERERIVQIVAGCVQRALDQGATWGDFPHIVTDALLAAGVRLPKPVGDYGRSDAEDETAQTREGNAVMSTVLDKLAGLPGERPAPEFDMRDEIKKRLAQHCADGTCGTFPGAIHAMDCPKVSATPSGGAGEPQTVDWGTQAYWMAKALADHLAVSPVDAIRPGGPEADG